MDLTDIVSISGLAGLYVTAGQRQDGLIVTSLEEDRSRFVSARQHTFTSLENISIYTRDNNTKELKEVFRSMFHKEKDLPPPNPDHEQEVKEYFRVIVPEYDEDNVYYRDMKKIIKWYHVLKEKDMINEKELEPLEEGTSAENITEKETPEKKKKNPKKPSSKEKNK